MPKICLNSLILREYEIKILYQIVHTESESRTYNYCVIEVDLTP